MSMSMSMIVDDVEDEEMEDGKAVARKLKFGKFFAGIFQPAKFLVCEEKKTNNVQRRFTHFINRQPSISR